MEELLVGSWDYQISRTSNLHAITIGGRGYPCGLGVRFPGSCLLNSTVNHQLSDSSFEFEFERRFYALSASEAIFKARTYSHDL